MRYLRKWIEDAAEGRLSPARKAALAAIFIVVLFSALYFSNHYTEESVYRHAKHDLAECSTAFESAVEFCKELSSRENADVDISYFKSPFAVQLTDSVGEKRVLRMPKPDFVNCLEFEHIGVDLWYNRRKQFFGLVYPYHTYGDLDARIVHCRPEDVRPDYLLLEGDWYLQLYEPR
ncbi:MAG: hypothetical protein EOP04_11150 [Proteobacteria bacterium]|nr:MAG: hypothetical protein EOP04_11150 [Pseudomonadota bacterium]